MNSITSINLQQSTTPSSVLRTLILTSSNLVRGYTNRFSYNFPEAVNLTGCKIGLQSIAIYNCTFNIMSAYANNTFSVVFPNNVVSSTQPLTYGVYTFLFPDSYMSASDMNFFLQQQCILNNLYAVTANGKNVYFIEIEENAPRYAIQLNTYTIPTQDIATSLGYTLCPNASFTWSSSATGPVSPSVTFPQAFGNLIGFTSVDTAGNQIYFPQIALPSATPTPAPTPTPTPTTDTGGLQPHSNVVVKPMATPVVFSTINNQFLSTKTPEMSPISTYVLTCNAVQNRMCIPQNTFFSMPLNASLGNLMSLVLGNVTMINITGGTYLSLDFTILDQNFNDLNGKFKDPDVVITLQLEDVRQGK